MDEIEVWRRSRAGDRKAFSALMREHGHSVYRYAWRLADERAQVEDLVQETFLQLWAKRVHIEVTPNGSVLPWLLTTCRYLTYNANRRQRHERTVTLDHLEGRPYAVDTETTRAELHDVANAIAALSPADQELCRRCLVDGESYNEAAEALGITTSTARKRLQRARARLASSRTTN